MSLRINEGWPDAVDELRLSIARQILNRGNTETLSPFWCDSSNKHGLP